MTAGNTAQLGGFGVKTFETEEAVTVCDYYPGWPDWVEKKRLADPDISGPNTNRCFEKRLPSSQYKHRIIKLKSLWYKLIKLHFLLSV